MLLFYCDNISDNQAILDANDSGHLVRVLRKTVNDEVFLTDGKGMLYKSVILEPDPRGCSLKITDTNPGYGKRDYYLHMAVAPTKNLSRFEWFVEKATEIGVDEITPLICHNSERNFFKPERMQRIAVAAMKQSLKAYLPKINDATGINELIKTSTAQVKLIAYIHPEITQQFNSVPANAQSYLILIGPEGDFSKEEVDTSLKHGYLPISLGNSRLRTETAAVYACGLANYIKSTRIH